MIWTLSHRSEKLKSSAIRDLLKVTERPEVISFAGGVPAPSSFPVAHMHAAIERVMAQDAISALQYSSTEGYLPLRQWIAAEHAKRGVGVDPEQVLITSGSQQGLDLLAKVLVDPGSRVLVEAPTYLGALQALSVYEPQFCSVPCDASGPRLGDLRAAELTGARLFYCIPNFQNPTGRRMPLARRRACVELSQATQLPIVEDDPYGALSYVGDELPSLWSLDPNHVVYLGSFSKLLAPGLRVGYMIAPSTLYPKLVQAKQAVDLHTSSFAQRVIFEAVKDGFLNQHIPQLRALYAEQCRVMLDALERELPSWVQFSRPEGGMFVWLQLPVGNDASELLRHALTHDLAFVPGATFFADRPQKHTLRLSFATPCRENICEGARRLGSLVRQHCHSENRGD